MTEQEARAERVRIEQSNEVAGIVIDAIAKARPDEYVPLTVRYGIADAFWAAGYRKVVAAPSDTDLAALLTNWDDTERPDGWNAGDEHHLATLVIDALRSSRTVDVVGMQIHMRAIEALLTALGVTDDYLPPDIEACWCEAEQGVLHLIWHLEQRASKPVQVEPRNPENLEIVNGWLVERGVNPLDYPAGAAYGAQPYSDAEPLFHLSEIPGWPVQVEVTEELIRKARFEAWEECTRRFIELNPGLTVVPEGLSAARGGEHRGE